MVQAQSTWAMNKGKQESAIYGVYWEGKGIGYVYGVRLQTKVRVNQDTFCMIMN